MDPKRLQHDLQRIERRLGELDAQRENTRDIAAEALDILRRPEPKEGNTVAGNYFIGSDGRRRDFDATGRELGNQGGSTTAAAPFRRTLPNPDIPRPGSQTTQAQPGVIRSLPPPAASASARPGDLNTFTGSNGVVRQISTNGAPAGNNSNAPTISRTLPASILRPDTQPNTSTPAISRTLTGAQPSAPPGFSRPLPGQQQPTMSLTRPVANPVAAAIGIPFDEAVRRAEMASSDFHLRGNTKTRSQREQILANQSTMRSFWLGQAESIPGAAQRMAEYQAEQGSAERIAGTEAATAMQRTQAENDARLQGIQMQEQGANARNIEQIAAKLRRPQPPIQLGDGTLVQLGPDGQLQPYTLPDGTPARGSNSQVDQSALARLSTDLMPQFLGADSYGMVPDAAAEDGVRYPTQEERLAAFRQASSAARETLSGSTAADPQRQQQTSTRPTGSRPASQEAFLERARAANPGYSDDELIAFYAQTYGNR